MTAGDSGDWIVAVSEPQRESWAAQNVRRQGFDAYYPRYSERYVDRKRRVARRTKSLFPRYVFVRTDGRWHFLLETYGMSGVCRRGDGPLTMRDADVRALQKREGADGMIAVPQVDPRPPRFRRDQRLRVTHGPMCGLYGVCKSDLGKPRVRVLFRFLRREVEAMMPRNLLTAA